MSRKNRLLWHHAFVASVLIVEDDANLREALEENLRAESYDVRTAATVSAAWSALSSKSFDVVLLDVMLPDGDGYEVCVRIRAARMPCRVLMLTARTLEDDLVRGFQAGADDYVAKPYRLRELLARIASLVRRGALGASGPRRIGAFSVDEAARTVTGPDGLVDLTRTEFDLVVLLAAERERVHSRDEILDRVWGSNVVVDPHTVDNFISSVKKKMKTANPGFEIRTVRGVGFQLRDL